MVPGNYNISIIQNATFRQRIVLKDVNRVALNLAGYSFKSQIWTPNKTKKIADITINTIDYANGLIELYISPEVTSTIIESGYWDLLVTNPSGDKQYWLKGKTSIVNGYSK